MAIARGFAAAAMLAGLAVGTATTAWADPMSGSYTLTSISPGGTKMTTDWTVQPCGGGYGGDGCIYVKAGAGGSQAHLIDGQWVLDTMNDLRCPDGQYLMFATNAHMVWDPNTLAGTNQISYIMPACGHPAGYVQTNQISLKASSSS
jgi:hypothetical protein